MGSWRASCGELFWRSDAGGDGDVVGAPEVGFVHAVQNAIDGAGGKPFSSAHWRMVFPWLRSQALKRGTVMVCSLFWGMAGIWCK